MNDLKDPTFKNRFNLNGVYSYSKILEDNIKGKNDSWGIWWWWTVCSNSGLVVYPKKSLVYNNGFDRSGIHSGEAVINQPDIIDLEQFKEIKKLDYPKNIAINTKAEDLYISRINSNKFSTIFTRGNKKASFLPSLTPVTKILSNARRVLNSFRVIDSSSKTNMKINAQLGMNSQIYPEGSIENIIGEPARVKIGDNTCIKGRLLIYGHGGQIKIGDWCFIGPRSEIWSMDSIQIGNRVLISHDVNIHDGTGHSTDPVERHEHFKKIITHGHPRTWEKLPGVNSSPIIIEDDVWISFGATILKGVRIGARSIIAAKSIVTKDVPPDSIYMCEINPIITPIKKDE